MKLLLASGALALFTLVSVEQEIDIGRSTQQQVRRQLVALDDAQVAAYVRALGARLVAKAPGPKYPYSFTVANYREINAFALPGGPIWINRGVIQAAADESQVAGVVAHEIAHVAQRHAASQLTKAVIANWGLGFLGAILGNSGGAGTAQVAASLLTNGVFLKFNRDDEVDADKIGLQILTRAGWSGRGMIELFETLRRTASRDPAAVETFFSTHPSPRDRIERLRAATGSGSGTRDSREFQTIKTRMARLPAAKSQPRQ